MEGDKVHETLTWVQDYNVGRSTPFPKEGARLKAFTLYIHYIGIDGADHSWVVQENIINSESTGVDSNRWCG